MTWTTRAACRDMPLSDFYPARGQALEPAKAACAVCPVIPECLAEADATEDQTRAHVFGFRGGLSVERRLTRRQGRAS